MEAKVWYVALAIVVLNLPFGWWRAGVVKFSRDWFLAVHIPVPIAIGIRLASGLGWRFAALPLFIFAFFIVQLLGGRARQLRSPRANAAGGAGP
ncbi:MAG: hypothetical protein HY084_07430 [Gemmatimonadetes bacterium]|nr:hypothetical protein [Gemmatimonadota bacterium]